VNAKEIKVAKLGARVLEVFHSAVLIDEDDGGSQEEERPGQAGQVWRRPESDRQLDQAGPRP
jgi:hypothetical protein